MANRATLPALPHLDHLKKQAKTRLATMRLRVPTARLTDAQQVVASEYGFESWSALKTEVERRAQSFPAAVVRMRRHPLAVSSASPDFEDDEPESLAAFVRTAAIVHIGFLLAALVGIAAVFTAIQPLSRTMQQVAQLLGAGHD